VLALRDAMKAIEVEGIGRVVEASSAIGVHS
jgi:hypothetical protein